MKVAAETRGRDEAKGTSPRRRRRRATQPVEAGDPAKEAEVGAPRGRGFALASTPIAAPRPAPKLRVLPGGRGASGPAVEDRAEAEAEPAAALELTSSEADAGEAEASESAPTAATVSRVDAASASAPSKSSVESDTSEDTGPAAGSSTAAKIGEAPDSIRDRDSASERSAASGSTADAGPASEVSRAADTSTTAEPAPDPAHSAEAAEQLRDAAREPTSPLPQRTAQEMALGRSLAHVGVHTGPNTRAALDRLEADGAALDSEVFVRELPTPGSRENQAEAREVLSHEVAHAAETQPVATVEEERAEQAAEAAGRALAAEVDEAHRPSPEPGAEPGSEREASARVDEPESGSGREAPEDRRAEPSTTSTREHLGAAARGPGRVGLRREATQRPPRPEPAMVEGDPAEAFREDRRRPASGPRQSRGPSRSSRSRAGEGQAGRGAPAGATGAGQGARRASGAAPSEGQASREGAIDAGDAQVNAARPGRQQAPAERPPLEGEGVDGKTEAFVAAPPSRKAYAYDGFSAELDREAKQTASSYQDDLPAMNKELGAEPGSAEVRGLELAGEQAAEIAPADEREVSAEEVVPEAPQNQAFTGNQGLSASLSRRFDNSSATNAEDIDEAIADIETVDDSVETSPGSAPAVPLEGASDPGQIDEQRREGLGQAGDGQSEARRAVVEGRGPEAVQLREMDEEAEIGGVEQGAIEDPGSVEGMDEFKRANMPGEVEATFDEQNGESMRASLGEAESKVNEATQTRDADWDAEVEDAEARNRELVEDAQAEQEQAVEGQRRRIQGERQSTLDRQDQELERVRGEAEELDDDKRGEIEERVEEDEADAERRYEDAEQDAEDEVEEGERRAEAEKESAEDEAEEESWWDRATGWISDAIDSLVDAVNAIIDEVREAVNDILDAVRETVVEIIEAAAEFVKEAIEAFGEALSVLVDELLGDIFPELAAALNAFIDEAVSLAQQAVDVVADGLVAGVNALVDAVQAGLNAVLDAFQAAVNFAASVLQAALAGDWGEVLRLLLEAALELAGISPEAFYEFVGELQETIAIIVNDPLAFLGNLFGAVSRGVQRFVDNILEHLRTGFFEWIVGPLGELGISLPETWTVWSVLGIVLEVLGLTREGIRGVVVEELGEGAGEIFDFVWRYVEALITGGWKGLWEEIKADLSELWTMVVDGIKDWLIETIITQGTLKLLSMIDPSGVSQIVQIVLTAWGIYEFLRDNLQRIWGVVQSIVETISEIARGVLETAAELVEQALGDLVPIAISLLANLLGLSGITTRVRRIIEDIRETVREAIRKLIRRVRGMFSGAGGRERDEGEDEDEQAEAGAWWNVSEDFSDADNESHTARVSRSGNQAEVTVSSQSPRSLSEIIADIDDEEHPGLRSQLRGELNQINSRIASNADEQLDEEARESQQSAIRQDLEAIVAALRDSGVLEDEEPEPTAVQWSLDQGRAGRVLADPLTRLAGNTSGSPSTGPVLHRDVMERWVVFNEYRVTNPRTGERAKVEGFAGVIHKTHLLSAELHGPAEDWNLANASPRANSAMTGGPEQIGKDKRDETLRYEVRVSYHSDEDPSALDQHRDLELAEVQRLVGYYFASSFRVSVDERRPDGGLASLYSDTISSELPELDVSGWKPSLSERQRQLIALEEDMGAGTSGRDLAGGWEQSYGETISYSTINREKNEIRRILEAWAGAEPDDPNQRAWLERARALYG